MLSEKTIRPPRQRLASYPILMTVSVFTRLLINTASQLFNPFLPILAAGLGTNVVTLGQMLGLYHATALCSPLFGNLADRWGYRATMRLELLIGISGLFLVGSAQNLPMAMAGLLILGLGFFAFVPTLRAYLAELLPYHRRTRGFGILEYSWALSGIVGLYLMGQLIARFGWRAPFFVLGGGLVICWIIYAELPPTGHAQPPHAQQARGWRWQAWGQRLAEFVRLESNQRSTWATIGGGTFASFGLLHIATAYGAWLVDRYGLSAQQLGTVAFLIGCADLCGSVSASLVADRVGKVRSVLAGWSGALLVAIALPWLDRNLVWAVALLVLLRAMSEYSIISHIALTSGQSTTQRGKVMTLAFAIGRLGGTLASFSGPPAYTTFGLWGLGPVAALALGIGVLITWRWVQEAEQA